MQVTSASRGIRRCGFIRFIYLFTYFFTLVLNRVNATDLNWFILCTPALCTDRVIDARVDYRALTTYSYHRRRLRMYVFFYQTPVLIPYAACRTDEK